MYHTHTNACSMLSHITIALQIRECLQQRVWHESPVPRPSKPRPGPGLTLLDAVQLGRPLVNATATTLVYPMVTYNQRAYIDISVDRKTKTDGSLVWCQWFNCLHGFKLIKLEPHWNGWTVITDDNIHERTTWMHVFNFGPYYLIVCYVFTRATLCIMRSLPSCGVWVSVCLSVRHTPVLCLNGWIYLETFLTWWPIILDFWLHAPEPRQRGRKIHGVGKLCDFRLKSPFIS